MRWQRSGHPSPELATSPSVDVIYALLGLKISQLALVLRWGMDFRLWYYRIEFGAGRSRDW